MSDSDGKKWPVVAIDGPGGSGKGTIGRLLASRLGWAFLDSGALYRVLALAATRHGIALDDASALAELASNLDVQFGAKGHNDSRIYLEKEDVTDAVRTEDCGNAASKVASLQAVRQALLERQRAFRQAPGLVADGRDMGTVVFPDAPAKIFLTASAEERAERRYKQLKEQGVDANLRQILADIKARDERDASRAVAPLVAAADAIVVDTTGLDIGEVEELLFKEVGNKIG